MPADPELEKLYRRVFFDVETITFIRLSLVSKCPVGAPTASHKVPDGGFVVCTLLMPLFCPIALCNTSGARTPTFFF